MPVRRNEIGQYEEDLSSYKVNPTLSAHEIAKDIAESKLTDFRAALQQARAAKHPVVDGSTQDTHAEPNPKELDSSHKVPVSLFPATAVIAGAFVMNLGNQMAGRTPLNWRDKPVKNTSYVSAVMRHLEKYMDGEDNDPDLSERSDQDVSHLWAALSSLAIMIDAQECGKLLDTRPPKGGAARMLARLTKEKKEA